MILARYGLPVFAAALLFSSTAFGGKTYQFEYQKIVKVEPKLQLTVSNANGRIQVKPDGDNQLRIDAVKNVFAESQEEADLVADHIQIKVEVDGNHYTVEPQFLEIQDRSPSFWQKLLGKSGKASYGSVDFTISVPVDCSADIYNNSGDIEISGVRGDITVSGTAGNTEIGNILGDIDLTTTSGKVDLSDIEGHVRVNATTSDIRFSSLTGDTEIRNSSGIIAGEYLIGDLTLSQASGNIELDHIEGNLRVKTISGKVTVGQDFGALDISTESGNVVVMTELNSSRDYYIETVSGTIDFKIPESSSGQVKLEAGSGDIDTQVPISIESFSRTRIAGSFGHGGPKITLATLSGTIRLKGY